MSDNSDGLTFKFENNELVEEKAELTPHSMDWSFSLEEIRSISGINLMLLCEEERDKVSRKSIVTTQINRLEKQKEPNLEKSLTKYSTPNQSEVALPNFECINKDLVIKILLLNLLNVYDFFCIFILQVPSHLSEFLVSTIFKDQKQLKKTFGVFQLFGEMDATTWFALVKSYCVKFYPNPIEIISYFTLFINEELHHWFYNLKEDDKSNLEKFETSFLNEVHKLECSYYDLVLLKQTSFMAKVKEKYKNNATFLSECTSNPLATFLKTKIMIIKKVYPAINKKDTIRMSIFSVDDKDIKSKLSKFVNSDLIDILNLAKSIDLFSGKN